MSNTALIIALCSAAAAPADPIRVDHHRQLFLDDRLIDTQENVTRVTHAARKHPGNPVLVPTEAWEGNRALLYGSVIRDDGKYRMWYLTTGGVGYAESDDGVSWTKPRLGLVKIDGQETNLVLGRDPQHGQHLAYFYEIFGVFKDKHEPDPARRYKMGFLGIQRNYSGPREDPFHRKQRRGLGVAGSPDGLHWKLIDSWATEAICDGGTHWMFDPARNAYVLYGRTKHIAPQVTAAWADNEWFQQKHWGRAVARVESPDFLHWNFSDPATAPVVMSADTRDAPGSEIYSMSVLPYEGLYIGLVQVFHNQPDACHLDIQLAVSRDGIAFDRIGDRSPFIPIGPVGSWDRFNNSVANNRPIPVGDELRFYYGGRTYRHSPYAGNDKGRGWAGIGFATIRRDRFVSLAASYDGGLITTKPLHLAGPQLHVNSQANFGEIVVEVLNMTGKPIATSQPIKRDSIDIPIRWATGALPNGDEPVRLRIKINNAHLFALWSH